MALPFEFPVEFLGGGVVGAPFQGLDDDPPLLGPTPSLPPASFHDHHLHFKEGRGGCQPTMGRKARRLKL